MRECLASVEAADRSGFTLSKVFVVDDASTDDSLDHMGTVNLPTEIIRNTRHQGYGASSNLAAVRSKADYLLFLNTDTCVTLHALTQPVAYMERLENREVANTGIKLLDDFGRVSRGCARFPSPGSCFVMFSGLHRFFPSIFRTHKMKEWDHLNTQEVDHVIGAFMLMRRSVFAQLGGYDERFFVYMEDVDLSLRASQLGFKSIYLATTFAYHKGGGTAKEVWAESLFFSFRSLILYGFKHFGFLQAVLLACGVLVVEPFPRLARGVLQRSLGEVMATLQAYTRLWGWLLSWKKR